MFYCMFYFTYDRSFVHVVFPGDCISEKNLKIDLLVFDEVMPKISLLLVPFFWTRCSLIKKIWLGLIVGQA